MNPEIKEQIDIIVAAYWKIRAELLRDPKIGFVLRCAYYLIKAALWLIKLVK